MRDILRAAMVRKRLFVLVIVFSFVMPLAAKSPAEAPDAPHMLRASMEMAVINPVLPAAKEHPPRVADKRFWTVTLFEVTMTQYDIATTMRSLNNHECSETLSARIVGSHPSHMRLQMTGLAGDAGMAMLSYWLKKKGHKNWWLPQFAAGTAHAGAASWNHFGSGCY
jgi:hypothetical protein